MGIHDPFNGELVTSFGRVEGGEIVKVCKTVVKLLPLHGFSQGGGGVTVPGGVDPPIAPSLRAPWTAISPPNLLQGAQCALILLLPPFHEQERKQLLQVTSAQEKGVGVA